MVRKSKVEFSVLVIHPRGRPSGYSDEFDKGFASLTICSILYEVTGTDSLDTQSLPAIHDKCVDGMMRTFSFSPPPHHHAEHAVEQIPIEAPSGYKLCSGAVHIGIA